MSRFTIISVIVIHPFLADRRKPAVSRTWIGDSVVMATQPCYSRDADSLGLGNERDGVVFGAKACTPGPLLKQLLLSTPPLSPTQLTVPAGGPQLP